MDILTRPREVTDAWHLSQVERFLDFDAGRKLDSVLVYAAFELRLAIERLLFDMLYLLRGQALTEDEERRCRSLKGIESLLKDADSTYRRNAAFVLIITELHPEMPPVTPSIDPAYLRRKWQHLSEYCHMQLRPEKSFSSPSRSFQREGFALIKDVASRVRQWLEEGFEGMAPVGSMEPEVRSIYDKFASGEIDRDQAKRMLRIAEPALSKRRIILPPGTSGCPAQLG